MRLHMCIAMLLIVAACILVSALPATATGPVSANNTGNGGYTVKIVKSMPLGIRPMASYGSVTQGSYQYPSKTVNYNTTQLPFDLYWGNPANSLRLRIYTPDGYLLGPYYDSSDGSYNGEISLYVSRDSGVAQGQWTCEVYGDYVTGTQTYSLS